MRYIRNFFLVGLVSLFSIALLAGPVSAQDDSGLGTERDLTASISVYQSYDTNIFNTEEDEEGDFITTITPHYSLFFPFRFFAVRAEAGIPIFVYSENRDESEAFFDLYGAITTARWRGFSLMIEDHLAPTYVNFGQTELEESNKNKVQANYFSVTPSYELRITSKSKLLFKYVFTIADFLKEEIGEDYYLHEASVSSETFLTARLSLLAYYGYIVRDLRDQDVIRYSHLGRVGLLATWTRISFGIYGGVIFVDYDRPGEDWDDVGEYVEVTFGWIATDWLTIKLGYRRVLTGDVYANTFFIQNLDLDFEFPVTHYFTWAVGGFVRDYRAESLNEDSDLLFGGHTDFIFSIMDELKIRAGYSYQANTGDLEENDFGDQFVTIGLNYRF